MKNYFQVKVVYDKPFREGEEPQQNKPETYLVDALSFAEAEARAIEALTPFAVGGIEVKSVTKSAIEEIVGDGSDILWYKVKVGFISIDNDKAKRTPVTYLINGDDFEDVFNTLARVTLKDITSDYEIISIAESSIIDIIKSKETEVNK